MRRKILITGATDGIGLELAKMLAPNHDLLLTGRRAEDEVQDILPPQALYCQADQSNPLAAAQAIIHALGDARWAQIDYAVLNAGTGFVADPMAEDIAKIDLALDVNVAATLAISHAIAPFILKDRGTLTVIGSVAHKGASNLATYAASKAALNGFVRALRAEWRGRARVQIIHPGPTRTDMQAKAGMTLGAIKSLFLSADDMARMIRFTMAGGHSPVTASWLRFLAGGAYLGKRFK